MHRDIALPFQHTREFIRKPAPAQPGSQPTALSTLLLRSLNAVRCGSLSLITPQEEKRSFSGSEAGPVARMQVHDWRVFDETAARGQIGFAESYLDGRFDSNNLPVLLTFFLTNMPAIERYFYGRPLYTLWTKLRYALQGNSLQGSRRNVASHYNLGNDFYSLWLDSGMTYSSALFEGDATRTLEEAQNAKYRRILSKLNARPGDHILEIGSGWGGFAEAAARQGLRVTALTLSEPQASYARARLMRAGLAPLAQVELLDYRECTGKFDHIVSIGMFEHVGEKYWPDYFSIVHERLKPGGKAMIQSIVMEEKAFGESRGKTGFIEHYIFPGGMLPSASLFRQGAENAGLACKEQFFFGKDYKRTLEHWLVRFEAKKDIIRATGRDEYFIRLWRFYLASCIAAFATGRTSVMQAELERGA